MNSFELYNPTKLIFGKDSFDKISTNIPSDKRILITYGGGSIMKNGVYDALKSQLKNHTTFEFGGIEPNPSIETLSKALEIIKSENIDYLFAVGGGSVIDGTKFLAGAALYEGDPWEILARGIRIEKALPFAALLTLPATGSEMNSGAVISKKETNEKYGMGGPALFPQISFLNPEVIKSLPKRQLVNGLVDSFVHVLEQYMTYPSGAFLQDRISESILSTLIEISHKVVSEPYDYNTASNFMWSCNMALNGLIQKGVPTDWTTHRIGHELTAMYGIDHAMTLAIIMPNLWNHKFENKKEKLAQYAERVFNVNEGTIEEKAHKAIEHTLRFFESLDIDTKLSSYTQDYDMAASVIKSKFEERKWTDMGERKDITPTDVYEIVKMSY